jgi:hemerythrin-like metal-binding protein
MRIEWSRTLETGCRTIDLQHEELVGMINELHDANPLQVSRLGLEDMLQRLDGYIAFHFGTEESLMAKLPSCQDHINEHLQQHRLFIDQVEKVRASGGDNVALMMREMADFLSDWLYAHILKTDCKLALILNGKTKVQ